MITEDEILCRKVAGASRSFALTEWELRSDGDGRTVEGRIVPYNEVVKVVDFHPLTGDLFEFREQFLRGSCKAMEQACKERGNASWIGLNLDHDERNLSSKIGCARTIADGSDGAYATFRLYEGQDLDKVRSMLRESHTGLSVKFADTRQAKLIDGIVSRVQVHIDHVAATPDPNYRSARVLAMRDDQTAPVEYGTPKLDAIRAWLEANRTANVG